MWGWVKSKDFWIKTLNVGSQVVFGRVLGTTPITTGTVIEEVVKEVATSRETRKVKKDDSRRRDKVTKPRKPRKPKV